MRAAWKTFLCFVLFGPAHAQAVVDLNTLNDLSYVPLFKIQPLRDSESVQSWIDPDLDDSEWPDFYAPENWNKGPYSDYYGPVVYRLSFNLDILPDDQLGVYLGSYIDNDHTYLNGKPIGHNGILGHTDTYVAYDVLRFYRLPNSLLRKGKNVVAMVITPIHGWGLFAAPSLSGPPTSLPIICTKKELY